MILKELKAKVLALIEESDGDVDIDNKFNGVINQVMYEVCRIKKLPKYCEIEVKKGDLIDFADIEKECGYVVFQIESVRGVDHEIKASGTVYKALEAGVMEIEVFVYPERINAKTNDSYEFELTEDVLEVMVYGIAADLLMTDVSSNYGNIYRQRYETMLNRLDTRQNVSVIVEGGVVI